MRACIRQAKSLCLRHGVLEWIEFTFRTTTGKEKQLDCVLMGKEAGDVVLIDAESHDAKRTSVISLVNNAYSC